MRYPIPPFIKEHLRRALEFVGISRYSRLGKYNLDFILEAYLPTKGVFLEVGAIDGLYASNTYYLERMRGWSGILIEPVPYFFRECVRHRKKSKVFNCALVSSDYKHPTVPMVFASCGETAVKSTTSPDGEKRSDKNKQRATEHGRYEFDAPARTLTSVLEEAGVSEIDFFSLDVEGYEIQVLSGLDMVRFRPKWLLVECLTPESKAGMQDFLSARNYEFVAQVTPRDLLWRTAEPRVSIGPE